MRRLPARYSPRRDFDRSFMVTADLSEALDAVDLLREALAQSIAGQQPTWMQAAAIAVADGLQRKHGRAPAAANQGRA
jgi:hypothetical protein